MPTQLTEVQAWEEVARRFIQGETEAGDGLCWTFDVLHQANDIETLVFDRMNTRIDSYLFHNQMWAYESKSYDGVYKYCVKNDEGRALAALWLMCEAAEEQGVRL